jgi:hypothetical protein
MMKLSFSAMDRLSDSGFTLLVRYDIPTEETAVTATATTTIHPTTPDVTYGPRLDTVLAAITKRSFATLSTASAANRAHVAGILYAAVVDQTNDEAAGFALYVNTLRSSRKARNIAGNLHVGVCIPIRRLPVGPPSSVQFQGAAEVLDKDDPRIAELLDGGHLRSITSHGELDLPDGCFIRITPGRKLITYGLGMPLHRLIRDPLHAGGSVTLDERPATT